MNAFETLNALNVNGHTEGKRIGGKDLTYLSWTWAWAETKKRYPEASYSVYKNPATGLPYVFDPETGYMVFTSVTIEGVTHEMWLPVMDNNNQAMKAEEYKVKTQYREITVAPATMMNINKAIMRCLTKNLAMFGLGLYIYAGEDLPESEDEPEPPKQDKKPAQKKEAAHPKDEAPKANAAICERCQNKIVPVPGRDGSEFTVQKLIAVSQKRFGKNLCAACQRIAEKEAKAAGDAKA